MWATPDRTERHRERPAAVHPWPIVPRTGVPRLHNEQPPRTGTDTACLRLWLVNAGRQRQRRAESFHPALDFGPISHWNRRPAMAQAWGDAGPPTPIGPRWERSSPARVLLMEPS